MKRLIPIRKPMAKKLADQKTLIMEAWDRLYPGDKEAEKQKERERLWGKEEINRKARSRL